ncbi:hypothetical protein AAFN85_00620 [Mucilaginibacter sp. CAU 1740]|uniref:hypothetical protein n=1 Tax=Mucilaginibacter sp. CAU 1740 TaxID=3140365 RepID=UPI00325AF6DE
MKELSGEKHFLYFLNRNYYAASHVAERLDDLADLPLFADLKVIVAAAIKSLELQLSETDNIFTLLKADHSASDCEATIFFMEGTFSTIQNPENTAPYLSLLDYVSIADAIMHESAELAGLSLAQLPGLSLPKLQLYDSRTLGSLKTLLEETYIAL